MTSYCSVIAIIILISACASGEKFYLGSNSGSGSAAFTSANLLTHLQGSIIGDRVRLTNGSSGAAGIAFYPQPVTAHLGFRTVFGWNSSACGTLDAYAMQQSTDGVQIFLSERAISIPDGNPPSSALMGIGSLRDIFAVGYVGSLNEYHICDWDGWAMNYNVPFFRQNCRVFPSTKQRLSCSYHEFLIEYNDATNVISLRVDNDSNPVVSYIMPRKLKPVTRYIGIAAGNDQMPRQQELTKWIWESRSIGEFAQADARVTTYGSAFVDQSNRLILTNSPNTVGIGVFRDNVVQLSNPFTMTFKWTALGQSLPSDGDGFVLFFTKPRLDVISDSMSIGSGLGVQYRNNMSIIGYNRVLNEFYVCSWTTPINAALRDFCPTYPNPLPTNQMMAFEVSYNQDIFEVYANGELLVAAELVLDKTEPFTIGFSGSTSTNSVTQYISELNFKLADAKIDSRWSYNPTNFNLPSHFYYIDMQYGYIYSASTTWMHLHTRTYFSHPAPNDIGAIVHKTGFAADQGFVSKFTYDHNSTTVSTCFNATRTDSITWFLTADPLVFQMKNLTYGELGLKQLRNVLSVTFNHNAMAQITVCKWGVHNYNTADFRDALEYCTLVQQPMADCLHDNKTYNAEVKYANGVLTFSLDNIAMASVPMFIAPNSLYFTGLISSDQTLVNSSKVLKEWSLQYYQAPRSKFNFTLANQPLEFSTRGSGVVANGTIQVAANSVGMALYRTPLPARFGFATSFTWRAASCTGSDVGFTLFLTTALPASNAVLSSVNNDAGYGTSSLSRLTSISYVATRNRFVAYFNSTLGQSSTLIAPNRVSTSCNDGYAVTIEYTPANVIRVYLHGAVAATFQVNRTSSVISSSFYYIGLSSTEGTFDRWNFTALSPPNRRQFNYGFNNAVISTLGTASVIGNSLRLTTGGSESGVAYYPTPLYTHTGFNSSLTWTPANCDAANNGADGFTLFFSKNRPQQSEVYLSSGGLLGVGSIPNVTMFAYSATFNQFYVCNWTVPLTDNFRWVCNVVVPSPVAKLTCSGTYNIDYSYDGDVFTLRVNTVTYVSTPLKLDPVPYFVGLSGATGGGYFTQDVSNWTFDSTAV